MVHYMTSEKTIVLIEQTFVFLQFAGKTKNDRYGFVFTTLIKFQIIT